MIKKLDILFEDNHLLVINKPAVLATMGAVEGEPTLHQVACDYIRTKYKKPGNVYLGVVSRLDAFVTGVIVLARTSKAAGRLTDQFRRRSVEKKYWAIVPGPLPSNEGSLEHWMYKNDAERRMKAVSSSKSGKFQLPESAKIARLDFRKISQDSNGKRCLIEVNLETGRKHQIRAQLSDVGLPIIGDRKYGSEARFPNGIALHSRSLQMEHPTLKTQIAFEADPPDCWNLESFGI